MSNKFYGLTIGQWELLLAKVPQEIIDTLNVACIRRYCLTNKIPIPCEKIEHIICKDVRPRNTYDIHRIIEKYEMGHYAN